MFKLFRVFYLSLVSLLGLCGAVAIGNYTMTQGAGTSFGSIVIGGTVHYAQQLICDYVTPTQCANVSAGGAISTADAAVLAAINNPIPDCAATPCANKIGNVYQQSQYPANAVPITASSTGTTGATTATLAAAIGKTTYICGFSIRANATAAVTGNATVSGTITGTLNFTQWTAPTALGLGITEMIFAPCVPASATNTTVSATSAAPGTGGVVSATSWGYQL